jgi:AraC-like DNA-binding protein
MRLAVSGMMTRSPSLESSLRSDVHASPHVRVRSWQHAGPRQGWPAAVHTGVEIAYVAAGAAHYRLGARELEIGAERAILVSAGVEHATTIEPGTRATSVWIDGAWFRDLAAALGCRVQAGALTIGDNARVRALLSLLEDEAREPRRGRTLAVDALAEALCVSVLRNDGIAARAGAHPLDARVLSAIAFIEGRFMDSVGVDEIADAAGISRFHFSRLFREQTGKSPYRYLMDTRVDRAAELLKSGRYTVTEAALSVGCDHLPRFAKAFRLRHGCPPSALSSRAARVRPVARSA